MGISMNGFDELIIALDELSEMPDSVLDGMLEAGAKQALMSGSGPTVFGIFSEKEQAERAGKQIRREGLARQIYTVKPYHTKGESGGNRWTGSR